eukprot:1149133-Pyramimonas_sp.AAC.1
MEPVAPYVAMLVLPPSIAARAPFARVSSLPPASWPAVAEPSVAGFGDLRDEGAHGASPAAGGRDCVAAPALAQARANYVEHGFERKRRDPQFLDEVAAK